MATVLDPAAVARDRWWARRPGARKAADQACRDAIERAGLQAADIDLLLNAGLYHDRVLSEPALAALIQEDVGINPEDPHPGAHGTFSFDVANGSCGVLSALQIADGFLRARTIDHALVVASDADPGRGLAPGFPFASRGAAVVCHWEDRDRGLLGFHWANEPPDTAQGGGLRASVAFDGRRNVLVVEQDRDFTARAAALAVEVAQAVLDEHGLRPADVDLVVANPLTAAFRSGVATGLGVAQDRFTVVGGNDQVHTAALLVALAGAQDQSRLAEARTVLLLSAGAGITCGAALVLR